MCRDRVHLTGTRLLHAEECLAPTLKEALVAPRRRAWLRGAPVAGEEAPGRTLLEVGALARSEDHDLGGRPHLSTTPALTPARKHERTLSRLVTSLAMSDGLVVAAAILASAAPVLNGGVHPRLRL